MHLQSVPATREIDADNFDAAFEMFRPGMYVKYGTQHRTKDSTK